MAKVTSKLQVTIPKAVAERYGIRPGDNIEWQPAGAVIRVIPPGRQQGPVEVAERLRLFAEASARQREREIHLPLPSEPLGDRGWQREELYRRGSSH